MLATQGTTRRHVSISVAATLIGCSPQTLREMEIRGEIPPAARVEGPGLRFYDLETVEMIRLVREARRSGLPSLTAS